MARTAVHVTTLTANAFTAEAAGTAIDATNNHVIPVTAGLTEEFIIRVSHTTGSSKTVTVKSGDSPPALESGVGDISASFADGSVTPVVKYIGPLSSARFLQNDGTVNIDVTAGTTGFIEVYTIPRTA